MALAALEDEVLAIAPLQGWGLVLPAGDGLVSFQMRHRWGTHANILPVEDLPAGLRTPISDVRQIGPITQDDGPIETTQVTMGIATLVAIPLAGRSRIVLGGLGRGRAVDRGADRRAREILRTGWSSSRGNRKPRNRSAAGSNGWNRSRTCCR